MSKRSFSEQLFDDTHEARSSLSLASSLTSKRPRLFEKPRTSNRLDQNPSMGGTNIDSSNTANDAICTVSRVATYHNLIRLSANQGATTEGCARRYNLSEGCRRDYQYNCKTFKGCSSGCPRSSLVGGRPIGSVRLAAEEQDTCNVTTKPLNLPQISSLAPPDMLKKNPSPFSSLAKRENGQFDGDPSTVTVGCNSGWFEKARNRMMDLSQRAKTLNREMIAAQMELKLIEKEEGIKRVRAQYERADLSIRAKDQMISDLNRKLDSAHGDIQHLKDGMRHQKKSFDREQIRWKGDIMIGYEANVNEGRRAITTLNYTPSSRSTHYNDSKQEPSTSSIQSADGYSVWGGQDDVVMSKDGKYTKEDPGVLAAKRQPPRPTVKPRKVLLRWPSTPVDEAAERVYDRRGHGGRNTNHDVSREGTDQTKKFIVDPSAAIDEAEDEYTFGWDLDAFCEAKGLQDGIPYWEPEEGEEVMIHGVLRTYHEAVLWFSPKINSETPKCEEEQEENLHSEKLESDAQVIEEEDVKDMVLRQDALGIDESDGFGCDDFEGFGCADFEGFGCDDFEGFGCADFEGFGCDDFEGFGCDDFEGFGVHDDDGFQEVWDDCFQETDEGYGVEDWDGLGAEEEGRIFVYEAHPQFPIMVRKYV
ncbi:uncharacterized protein I303_101595 [Kwoniella dejecticola CBS 10117]|uniref:Uncharacterized protein n=1 Tax=Kwoniella dejecticola CBS 10117 TaxID=1296121 RepID=A0A1A6ADD2_9TREE|nr:uncharacterized protein I303_02271 [Kwoniella dejecticola CBS 10117]OBR88053.1 hypothetical protein I303_02271 [Kwoniella dejecticola CBS 10117]